MQGTEKKAYSSYLGMLRKRVITETPIMRGNTGAGVKSCKYMPEKSSHLAKLSKLNDALLFYIVVRLFEGKIMYFS